MVTLSDPGRVVARLHRKRLGEASQLFAASWPRRFRCSLATIRSQVICQEDCVRGSVR